MVELHFFLCVSLIFCGCLMCICVNPIESVLFLILAFFNAAGILFLFHAEFLGLLFIIIYVGAIAVLFLFVIMMLNIKNSNSPSNLKFLFACFYGIFIIVFCIASLSQGDMELALKKPIIEVYDMFDMSISDKEWIERARSGEVSDTKFFNYIDLISRGDLDESSFFEGIDFNDLELDNMEFSGFEFEESNIEILNLGTEDFESSYKSFIDSLSNIDVMGQVLFNYYLVSFLLAGIVLLIALIGAIVLTLRFNNEESSQLVNRQLARTDNNLSFFKSEKTSD